jgi:hypothetical protein
MTKAAICMRRKSGVLTAFVTFVRRGPNSAVLSPFYSLRRRACRVSDKVFGQPLSREGGGVSHPALAGRVCLECQNPPLRSDGYASRFTGSDW